MKTIAIQYRSLTNPVNTLYGLIGNTDQTKAIAFTTRLGIHTFFMKYPIDICLLDEQKIIKQTRSNLVPYRLFLWGLKRYLVLELPAGTIANLKLASGIQVVRS